MNFDFIKSFIGGAGNAVGAKTAELSMNLFPEITSQADMDSHRQLCDKLGMEAKQFENDVASFQKDLDATNADITSYSGAAPVLVERLKEAKDKNDTARVSALNLEVQKATSKILELKAKRDGQNTRLEKAKKALDMSIGNYQAAISYHTEMEAQYRELSSQQRANKATEAFNKRERAIQSGVGAGQSTLLEVAQKRVQKETDRLDVQAKTTSDLDKASKPSGELADIIASQSGSAKSPEDALAEALKA